MYRLPSGGELRGVLFDLDGTLLDTAQDMAAALNALRLEQRLPTLPFSHIRPVVSHGAQALIALGFELGPQDALFASLRQRFLDLYADSLARYTGLFPGMATVLQTLESAGIRWGIVTNKPGWLTDPLVRALALDQRAACVISGDTLPERKPHPAPLLHAATILQVPASACVYVGDAQRDIEAGQRAGMATLVALYGYIGVDEQPQDWGADGLLQQPEELLTWLAEPAL